MPIGILYPTYSNIGDSVSRNSYSPMETDFNVSVVSFNPTQVLQDKTFQINKELLKNNIRHHPLIKWFFDNFTLLVEKEIHTDWYSKMETKQQNIFFFDWFKTYHPKILRLFPKSTKNGQ